MDDRRWILCGALLGAVGVASGAFGAHGLPSYLQHLGYEGVNLSHRVENYQTAVRYQMLHVTALILVGVLAGRGRSCTLQVAGGSFLAGVLIFSGLLYSLTFLGPSWKFLGSLVPIGGLLLIGGWLAFAASFCCKPSEGKSAFS